MSAKITPRRAAVLHARAAERAGIGVQLRSSGASGIHADQNRRRGGKAARGGRQGERRAYRAEVQV